jgi:hypothetical protein
MRPNPVNAFEHTAVPHGEDGRMVRGIIARCGHYGCEAAIPLPVNTMQNGGGDDIAWQHIARKLEMKGWRIGKTRNAHRCPKCFAAAKAPDIDKAEANKTNAATNGAHSMNMKVVQENVRVMERPDRRIIFDKLNQVYVDDTVGYGPGWTDERVATDLGVPRAWVRLVREEHFGDEVSNEQIRRDIKDATAVLEQIRALQPEITRLMSLADKVEKSLTEIRKVFK